MILLTILAWLFPNILTSSNRFSIQISMQNKSIQNKSIQKHTSNSLLDYTDSLDVDRYFYTNTSSTPNLHLLELVKIVSTWRLCLYRTVISARKNNLLLHSDIEVEYRRGDWNDNYSYSLPSYTLRKKHRIHKEYFSSPYPTFSLKHKIVTVVFSPSYILRAFISIVVHARASIQTCATNICYKHVP